MALVITLIMLSVITFMAVTFLVLSHRERRAVSTTTDQATARLAAETALERAKAELLARLIAFTNDQAFDLTVSTNLINGAGFQTTPASMYTNHENVNYNYPDGSPLKGRPQSNDQLQNLANLFYNPRPPVIVTNRAAPSSQEFRFYLDLNRNGRYETNGLLPVLSADPANPYYHKVSGLTTNLLGFVQTNSFVGDPEWIGVLEYPDQPHSANNRFVSRYAYLVVPAGKTLDVNGIHNEARSEYVLDKQHEGFTRNQGVGSWEINLAAFLADLNTNYWNPVPSSQRQQNRTYYAYNNNPATLPHNQGYAFDDARDILSYRYNHNYASLQRANQLFPNNAAVFLNDGIDEYSDGPFMTGNTLNEAGGVLATRADPVNRAWAGADNPNHFFAPEEFFDANKTSGAPPPYPPQVPGFTNRLLWAGTNIASYDRYTFYRMVAQLGTDSAPETNKINVNYRNVTNGVVWPGLETNLYPWNPTEFFANAANQLLRTYTTAWFDENHSNFFGAYGMTNAFGVTNIPVFITGSFTETNVTRSGTEVYIHHVTNLFTYTPAVHRILQLAANIFDATSTNGAPTLTSLDGTNQAPTVWRPFFRRNPGPVVTNVFIVGYREVGPVPIVRVLPRLVGPTNNPMVDLEDSVDRTRILPLGPQYQQYQGDQNELMVYGIPLVVGAKKGLPNFNKFALQNAVTLTRKLQFHRVTGGQYPKFNTNQLFTLGIASSFGVQAWNSYLTNFSRPVTMIVAGDVYLVLTNQFGNILYSSNGFTSVPLTNHVTFYVPQTITSWPPFTNSSVNLSFVVPLLTNYSFLPNATFIHDQNRFVTSAIPERVNYFPIPNWKLFLKTRLRYVLLDTGTSRILDYVNLESSEDPINVIGLMRGENSCGGYGSEPDSNLDLGGLWCTNRVGNERNVLQVVDNPFLPTIGIVNQIQVSDGATPVDSPWWRAYNSVQNQKDDEIEIFNRRMFGDLADSSDPANIDFGAPFNPKRTFLQYVRWEANDPLVHYTVPDLADLLSAYTNKIQLVDQTTAASDTPVARLNGRNPLAGHYRPWGGNPVDLQQGDTNKFNTAVKDPLVARSDDWQFPTNKLPNIGWLGRVHRGTPWQTVYMKSSGVDAKTWPAWTGNNSLKVYRTEWRDKNGGSVWSTNTTGLDFANSMPIGDRLLFDVFTAAVNENASRGQLSVNQTNLAAWSAVLSGVIVLTNSSPVVANLTIRPAGIYSPANPPQLVRIVDGINNSRSASVTNKAGIVSNVFVNQVFNHAADILATPQLTEQSPFLNTANLASQTAGGINDGVMERIPQQIMGLLTLSHSPRFVVYAYGQTLKPADGSIYTGGGPFFGLCTNYQVTAETATRAVVRVEGTPDPRYTNDPPKYLDSSGNCYPPRLVVEQFNVLPPD